MLMKIIIIHFRRCCILSCISLHNWNQPVFHKIPQCTCPISHYVPFRTEKCTFLFWMVHCGIWDRCIVRFVNLVNCCILHSNKITFHPSQSHNCLLEKSIYEMHISNHMFLLLKEYLSALLIDSRCMYQDNFWIGIKSNSHQWPFVYN